jgi:hypothetical protein
LQSGRIPDSIKEYVDFVRENPEELVDTIMTTLEDYDLVTCKSALK